VTVNRSIMHVYPVDDLIEHDTTGDGCVCGPAVSPLERDDGSIGWLVLHHALDVDVTEPEA